MSNPAAPAPEIAPEAQSPSSPQTEGTAGSTTSASTNAPSDPTAPKVEAASTVEPQPTSQQPSEITAGQALAVMEEAKSEVAKLKAEASSYDDVFLIGTTGAGKSTLVHSIMGVDMKVVPDPNQSVADAGGVVVAADPSSKVKPPSSVIIGDTTTSCTTLPTATLDENNKLRLWDLPGLQDTRGGKQELVNNFVINEVFNPPCNAKVLLVLNEAEVTKVTRGSVAHNLFRTCKELIPEGTQLQDAMIILIRVPGNTIPEDEVKLAKAKLEEMFRKDDAPLLSLLQSVDQKGHIFWIPQAKKEQVGQPFPIPQMPQILAALQTVRVENPTHKMVFQESSKSCVLELLNECKPENPAKLVLRKMKSAFNSPEQYGDDYKSKLEGWDAYFKNLKANLPGLNDPKTAGSILMDLLPDQTLSDDVKNLVHLAQVHHFLVDLVKTAKGPWTERIKYCNLGDVFEEQLDAVCADLDRILGFVRKGAEMEQKLLEHEREKQQLELDMENLKKKMSDQEAITAKSAEEEKEKDKQLKELQEAIKKLEADLAMKDEQDEIKSVSTLFRSLSPVEDEEPELDVEHEHEVEETYEYDGQFFIETITMTCSRHDCPMTMAKRDKSRHKLQSMTININAWPDFFRGRLSRDAIRSRASQCFLLASGPSCGSGSCGFGLLTSGPSCSGGSCGLNLMPSCSSVMPPCASVLSSCAHTMPCSGSASLISFSPAAASVSSRRSSVTSSAASNMS